MQPITVGRRPHLQSGWFGAWARGMGGALLLGGCLASSFAASSFTGDKGAWNGGDPRAVSGDGKVVVGDIGLAVRWTAEGGMVRLGTISNGGGVSIAYAVSSDGSVVVGMSDSTSGFPEFRSTGYQAFRWTAAGGMVGLGWLPGGRKSFSRARGVSSDGSVVVGESSSASGKEAFSWTAARGMVGLGCLPGRLASSCANAVSGDGSVVVGESSSALGKEKEAFSWTAARGMVGLGYLPGKLARSCATAVSGDGLVVVGVAVVGVSEWNSGYTEICWTQEAFRWTAAGGMVGLGHLPGTPKYTNPKEVSTETTGVSSDGSVIVGIDGAKAFIWDSVNGMRNLESVLTNDYHLDLSGLKPRVDGEEVLAHFGRLDVLAWKLGRPTGISADGRTIFGQGRHFNHGEAWVARLDRPPNRPATKGESRQISANP